MSDEHLNLTLFQQVFDKIEETVIYESEKRIAEISKNPSGMTDKELDEEFENLNIEDYVNEEKNDKI